MKTLSLKMRKGFTLIELLVVIGILAILLAITLIAINPSRQFKQANDTKRASDVNAILNAVGQYAAEVANKGQLPTAVTAVDQVIGWDGTAGANLCAALVPTYIQALPTDPTTGDANPVAWVDTNADGTVDACPATYNTGYHIVKDANGRVTVWTTSEVDTSKKISVTR
jgi:type IV pilus assembly protein PilA